MSTHRTSIRTVAHALIVGACGTGVTLAAHAGEPASPNRVATRVVVSYADLDITDEAGVRTLYARLRSASEKACGGEPSSRELAQRARYRACYDRVLNKSVHRIDSDTLQALHARHAGRRSVG
jgi:UrcA family protein